MEAAVRRQAQELSQVHDREPSRVLDRGRLPATPGRGQPRPVCRRSRGRSVPAALVLCAAKQAEEVTAHDAPKVVFVQIRKLARVGHLRERDVIEAGAEV
jgi:hypothetical protein